jgi:cystathionine gamma-synthase
MVTGYPRFFIPRVVDRLAARILERFTHGDERPLTREEGPGPSRLGLILSSGRYASMARQFLEHQPEVKPGTTIIEVLVVTWDGKITVVADGDMPVRSNHPEAYPGREDLFVVSYPAELFPAVKAFWQHTGFGISSRRATLWIENAPFLLAKGDGEPRENNAMANHGAAATVLLARAKVDEAKTEIRKRIAAGQSAADLPVHETDVFLYHTGMTSITEVASAIKSLRPSQEAPCVVAVFGYVQSWPS